MGPFSMSEEVAFWWECETPSLCPTSCTRNYRGQCSTTANYQCVCDGWSEFKIMTFVLAVASAAVSIVVTSVRSIKYLRVENFRNDVKRSAVFLWSQLVCTIVPPIVQSIFLYII